MVEADLQERKTNEIFQINTQTNNCTGLASEERLIEEAVQTTELILVS
jgi:hypothetical protein